MKAAEEEDEDEEYDEEPPPPVSKRARGSASRGLKPPADLPPLSSAEPRARATRTLFK